MIFVKTTIKCDRKGCRNNFEAHGNQTDVIRYARSSSWTIGKKHTCPECNGKIDYQRCPNCNCLLNRNLDEWEYPASCLVCGKDWLIKKGHIIKELEK